MATGHTPSTPAPDSMSAGIGRLLIVAAFALTAALLWYYGGLPLKNKHPHQGGGHAAPHAWVAPAAPAVQA